VAGESYFLRSFFCQASKVPIIVPGGKKLMFTCSIVVLMKFLKHGLRPADTF
jgi:hypothetical protein